MANEVNERRPNHTFVKLSKQLTILKDFQNYP